MRHQESFNTLLAFLSPAGHNHDDNCRTRLYVCDQGHAVVLGRQNRCPAEGCTWVGKDECFCHDGKKVKEWPE